MALSDPELELLRELLEEDPEADVWAQVAEELVRRAEWAEAVTVLEQGVALEPDNVQAWTWYARSCHEADLATKAAEAVQQVPFDPEADLEAARLHILIGEHTLGVDAIRDLIARFQSVDPDDVVVSAVAERLDQPTPEGVADLSRDPLITMARAQLYVAVGRSDRAARVYRRILQQHPDYRPARIALKELGVDTLGVMMTEDLSQEIVDPSMAPPTLDMPEPRLSVFEADEEVTEPRGLLSAIEAFARGEGANPLPSAFGDDDEETTLKAIRDDEDALGAAQVGKKPRKRRRRSDLQD